MNLETLTTKELILKIKNFESLMSHTKNRGDYRKHKAQRDNAQIEFDRRFKK